MASRLIPTRHFNFVGTRHSDEKTAGVSPPFWFCIKLIVSYATIAGGIES